MCVSIFQWFWGACMRYYCSQQQPNIHCKHFLPWKYQTTFFSSYCGGAIWASGSLLATLHWNKQLHQQLSGGGGTIYANKNSSLTFNGTSTFTHNSADTFHGINVFVNNSPNNGDGGAIATNLNGILISMEPTSSTVTQHLLVMQSMQKATHLWGLLVLTQLSRLWGWCNLCRHQLNFELCWY